jgi:hypothetical protein
MVVDRNPVMELPSSFAAGLHYASSGQLNKDSHNADENRMGRRCRQSMAFSLLRIGRARKSTQVPTASATAAARH